MKLDQSNKHEALLKAKSLITTAVVETQKQMILATNNEDMKNESAKDFNRYLKSFGTHREAQMYSEGRGLNPLLVEVG